MVNTYLTYTQENNMEEIIDGVFFFFLINSTDLRNIFSTCPYNIRALDPGTKIHPIAPKGSIE